MHRPASNNALANAAMAAIVAFAVVVAGSGSAAAATPKRSGSATITSVDGPAALTLRNIKRQSVPIRLIGVDVPAPGECGATDAQAALQSLVDRGRLRGLHYSLIGPRKTPARATDGRYLARVSYSRKRDEYQYELGATLVDLGWARSGTGASLDSAAPAHLDYAVEADGELDNMRDRKGNLQGIWAKCGGRLHLPAGEPAPTTSAVPWTTDANGITKSIGPLALNPALTPDAALTFARAAELAGPIELVRYDSACLGHLPSLQLTLYSWTDRPGVPCGATDVQGVFSRGPGIASTDRGVKVGDSAQSVRGKYPLVDDFALDADTDSVPLAGARSHVWAWQTWGELDPDNKITGLTAWAVPSFYD